MLDNLIQLVKENAGDAIVKNPAIPNEHNDTAIATASESIMNTLKSQVGGGSMDGLMNLFKGGAADTSNPIMSAVQNNVAGDLAKKLGIDSAAAGGIASSLIPTVMSKFVSKTNDPNDKSFDLGDIVKNLGGNAGGIGGVISNFLK